VLISDVSYAFYFPSISLPFDVTVALCIAKSAIMKLLLVHFLPLAVTFLPSVKIVLSAPCLKYP
jgi:hypothetical protein